MNANRFPNGITVVELRRLLADWPDYDVTTGEPTTVWVDMRDGTTNDIEGVAPLNRRRNEDDMTYSADLLLII